MQPLGASTGNVQQLPRSSAGGRCCVRLWPPAGAATIRAQPVEIHAAIGSRYRQRAAASWFFHWGIFFARSRGLGIPKHDRDISEHGGCGKTHARTRTHTHAQAGQRKQPPEANENRRKPTGKQALLCFERATNTGSNCPAFSCL